MSKWETQRQDALALVCTISALIELLVIKGTITKEEAGGLALRAQEIFDENK